MRSTSRSVSSCVSLRDVLPDVFRQYLVSARNAAATVADSFMTAVLIYSLQRSRTGIKRYAIDSLAVRLVLPHTSENQDRLDDKCPRSVHD